MICNIERLAMPKKQIGCPICGAPMQKRLVMDSIEIDYCDSHGVWLDSGELEHFMSLYGRSVPPTKMREVGKSVARGFAGATVMGAGFNLGSRLVGGILDSIFKRQG